MTDVIQTAIAAGSERLRRHAAAIPTSEDPEDVHQARVATRRLRSDLRTLAPHLDEEWVTNIRGELKWLGEVLGAVRDADVLGKDPEDELLHEVRKRAKQCRYAAEAVVPVVGKPAAKMASAVAGVQEVLGGLQDAVVAEEWLRKAAAGGGTGSGPRALAAGQLIARQRTEMEDARRGWKSAWKAASSKKLRNWM